MPKARQCLECRADLVDDFHSGEVICSHCGIVVTDQMPDMGPEFSTNENTTVRASGHLEFSQHDLGITTTIDTGGRDYVGNPINRSLLTKMKALHSWQQRIRINGSRERRISAILVKINEVCRAMSLPNNVMETASLEYRNMDNRIDLRNKSVVAISAAVVYMACKKCDVIRTIAEIVNSTCSGHEAYTKTKLAGRYYRTLVLSVGIPRTAPVPMERYISRISNNTEADVRVERLALKLASKTRNHIVMEGKDPSGVAAAYLYIAAVLLGRDVIQQEVAEAASVTDVTVRSRCKEILERYDFTITLKPLRR